MSLLVPPNDSRVRSSMVPLGNRPPVAEPGAPEIFAINTKTHEVAIRDGHSLTFRKGTAQELDLPTTDQSPGLSEAGWLQVAPG